MWRAKRGLHATNRKTIHSVESAYFFLSFDLLFIISSFVFMRI